jgi:hypothetical protein
MFWLPLQGVVAFAMPYCQPQETQAASIAQQPASHCDHAMNATSTDDVAGTGPSVVSHDNCDRCTYCQLASFAALPVVFQLPSDVPASALPGKRMAPVVEAFTGLPYRPPII